MLSFLLREPLLHTKKRPLSIKEGVSFHSFFIVYASNE